MNSDPLRWLLAAAALAVLLAGGAHAWKTLQPAAATVATVPSEAVRPVVGSTTTTTTAAASAAAPAPVSARPAEPEPTPNPVVNPTPVAPPPVKSGVDAIKTKDRFINVSARCEAAEEAYRQIKSESAQQGQIPHPAITQAWSAMRHALDAAKRELDRDEIAEARASLDLAEASAGKVVRAAGGR